MTCSIKQRPTEAFQITQVISDLRTASLTQLGRESGD